MREEQQMTWLRSRKKVRNGENAEKESASESNGDCHMAAAFRKFKCGRNVEAGGGR